jgi:hypothetical protein
MMIIIVRAITMKLANITRLGITIITRTTRMNDEISEPQVTLASPMRHFEPRLDELLMFQPIRDVLLQICTDAAG